MLLCSRVFATVDAKGSQSRNARSPNPACWISVHIFIGVGVTGPTRIAYCPSLGYVSDLDRSHEAHHSPLYEPEMQYGRV